MSKFTVQLARTQARYITVEVEADSQDEANDKALEDAQCGDCDERFDASDTSANTDYLIC